MNKRRQDRTHKKIKIVICGYYGKGSLGDELILEAILSAIRSLSAQKCGSGRGFVLHIKIIRSKDPIKSFLALARSHLFIFGGGSLLQNLTSDASLLYYLTVIRVASVLSRHMIMLSNGLGPIKEESVFGRIGARLLPSTLALFDSVSVRDRASRDYIKRLLPDREIALIPDPVLTLSDADIGRDHPGTLHAEPYFVYVPCISGLKRADVSEKVLSDTLLSLSSFFGRRIKIAIFNEREDARAAERLARRSAAFSAHLIQGREDAMRLLGGAEIVISQRYHATLLALTAQGPVLSISDDPKMTALCGELGAFRAVPTRTLSSCDTLRQLVREAIVAHNESKKITVERLRDAEQKARTELFRILDKYIFDPTD